ncbi:Hypothetical protein D9617_14g077260 [Elsinoe fawcettii]|nr:Hypothetical protein D9617_14g077260 [Elsinoe fawcettii]
MAYMPPWRRHDTTTPEKKAADLPPGKKTFKSDPSVLPASDIVIHYFPDARQNALPGPDGVVSLQRSTLNGSAEKPTELVFVLLHHNANPHFDTEGLVYVKSRLDILVKSRGAQHNSSNFRVTIDEYVRQEGLSAHTDKENDNKVKDDLESYDDHNNGETRTATDPADDPGTDQENKVMDDSKHARSDGPTSKNLTVGQFIASQPTDDIQPTSSHDTTAEASQINDDHQVAVFDQTRHGRGNKDNDLFRFIGYYKVSSVNFCAPHSQQLKELLQRKWTWKDRQGNEVAKQRDVKQWQESFKHEWAELKLEKDEEYEKENGPPNIKRSKPLPVGARTEDQGKSVNELLSEMRMEGSKE